MAQQAGFEAASAGPPLPPPSGPPPPAQGAAAGDAGLFGAPAALGAATALSQPPSDGGAAGSQAFQPLGAGGEGLRARLVVHRVEGALGTAMASPFVRVHVVNSATGAWMPKISADTGRPAVFNLHTDGSPFLRTTQTRREPWQADVAPGSYIRPFSTEPCALRGLQGAAAVHMHWEEAFLLAEPLGAGCSLFFEVLDVADDRHRARGSSGSEAQEEEGPAGMVHFTRVGWGFLSMDGVMQSHSHRFRRRLRLQLHRYRQLPAAGSAGSGGGGADEEEAGRPDVFREYYQDGQEASGLAAALWSLGGRGRGGPVRRQPWPAVLEVSVEAAAAPAPEWSVALLTSLAPDAEGALGASARVSTLPGVAEEGGDGAKRAKEEELAALAKHHVREKGQRCALPGALLWQVGAGRRGAFRLSLSPSGRLLAAAVAGRGGAFELRTFIMATGRQHAVGMTLHDTLVYDLCWHTFEGAASQTGHRACQPLLISCSSDCTVQIYEVPEDSGAAPRSLRPHARLSLPSHVYSVRPHPTLSRMPERLVLVCGGHNFVTLCELPRHWVSDAAEGGGGGGKWVAGQPIFQQVPFPPDVRGHLGGESREGGREAARGEEEPDRPVAILCVRFSRQPTSLDNLYATDAAGRVMMFQVRVGNAFEGDRSSIRASYVRAYSAPELEGTPIHSLEVVTNELLEGRRLTHARLAAVDDYVLLHSRDHTIRLAALQRGAVSVVREMTAPGFESGNYPVRGGISSDGAYVACGSETGQLFVWKAVEGELLPPGGAVPRVQLAGPVLDVLWSPHHHLLTCCALDDQSPPLLAFVGGDPNAPAQEGAAPERTEVLAPPRLPVPVPPRQALRELPVEEEPPQIAASMDAKWTSQWLNIGSGMRSALEFDTKRQMKEQILLKIFDRKGAAELESHFASTRGALPGGLV